MEHMIRKLKSKSHKAENTPEQDIQNVLEPQIETPPAQDNTESTIQQATEPTTQSKKGEKYSFFLFVNPKSGGNKAAKLTALELQKMLYYPSGPDAADIELFIYDMTNNENRQLGFSVLKKKQEKGKKNLHAIVGGGDGTVLWVIDEMVQAQIDFATCPIGVIPFGTGNDFSRVLGWGGTEPPHLIGNHVEGLKRQAELWMNAKIEDFDIWDVKIETYDYGGLTHISKKKGPKFEKKYLTVINPETKEETRAYSFTRKMSNYFSFGVDSRIGYDFDKRRTHSQLQNKFVYAWEGAKQLFLRNPKVDDVLDEMSQYIPGKDKDDDKEEKEEIEELDQGKLEQEIEDEKEKEVKEEVREEPVREASPVTEEVHTEQPHESVQKQVQEEIHKEAKEKLEPTKEEDAQKQEEIVLVEQHPDSETSVGTQDSEGMVEEGFKLLTSSSFKLKEKEDSTANAKVSVMQGNHGVFLCLNIPSYMGGASDPWATSKGRVGIRSDSKDPLKDFEDQNFGDGKLELLGFKGATSLALERCVHGRGWRLGQVRGPFILNYKVSKDKNKPLHSYMQIDGEFYDVIAPKSVQVSLSKDIPNGKIKVLWTPQGKNISNNI